MGISRDSRHKHRKTGGRMAIHQKKRKYEMGRPPSNTKLGSRRVRIVRCRGGNQKFRALRLESGNFAWGSENCTRKVRLMDVVYNASNNELVRTKTLVKNAIVQIDATPFKQFYSRRYGLELGKKGKQEVVTDGKSYSVTKKLEARRDRNSIDPNIGEQFVGGRLLACISSRPGQSGRCDGYILEADELTFYKKKLEKKKKS
uniref:40S ribosomal protein S8 n=1 Tax=Noctiluca scintillans TaxID=2966 RepID=A0A7S1FFG5_NOCSC|mmetsp:Transcript_59129/g.157343  ORF Transcript_59129/g.157343 Transcript_59129/m.157343 type:complete len:202 (+) Transcript_59129:61-666(+)